MKPIFITLLVIGFEIRENIAVPPFTLSSWQTAGNASRRSGPLSLSSAPKFQKSNTFASTSPKTASSDNNFRLAFSPTTNPFLASRLSALNNPKKEVPIEESPSSLNAPSNGLGISRTFSFGGPQPSGTGAYGGRQPIMVKQFSLGPGIGAGGAANAGGRRSPTITRAPSKVSEENFISLLSPMLGGNANFEEAPNASSAIRKAGRQIDNIRNGLPPKDRRTAEPNPENHHESMQSNEPYTPPPENKTPLNFSAEKVNTAGDNVVSEQLPKGNKISVIITGNDFDKEEIERLKKEIHNGITNVFYHPEWKTAVVSRYT